MSARTISHAANDDDRGYFEMYMTPAAHVGPLDVHPDLIRAVALRNFDEITFGSACAYAVPDAGPFGEIEVAIDRSAKQACGGHRRCNPDELIKSGWFAFDGDVDDAVDSVYRHLHLNALDRELV